MRPRPAGPQRGLSPVTLQVTHKVEADIEGERDFIVDSVTAGATEAEVETIENVSTGCHTRNGGGDLIQTDGKQQRLRGRQVHPGSQRSDPAPKTVCAGRRSRLSVGRSRTPTMAICLRLMTRSCRRPTATSSPRPPGPPRRHPSRPPAEAVEVTGRAHS
jgi:hypothetical protein